MKGANKNKVIKKNKTKKTREEKTEAA